MKVISLLKSHTIRPRKRLGQNFLIDNNVRDKLCDALELTRNETVIEIGAGCGMLTERLAERAGSVYAIECDKRLCAVLEQTIVKNYDNVTLIPESVLSVSLEEFAQGKQVKVIGNLPYYITTKILFHLARYRQCISRAICTMQKEVAERILSLPGKKAYGRLTVSMRFMAEIEKLFTIKPTSFYPLPEVTSTVIQLRFLQKDMHDFDETLFLGVVEALFQERRKRVVNSLCLLKSPPITKALATEIIASCNISTTARAEELAMEDFFAVTKAISVLS